MKTSNGSGIRDPQLESSRIEIIRTDRTANLPTKILDFRGFDSSRSLIVRGGISRPTGNLAESLRRATLVGIILVVRLGRVRFALRQTFAATPHLVPRRTAASSAERDVQYGCVQLWGGRPHAVDFQKPHQRVWNRVAGYGTAMACCDPNYARYLSPLLARDHMLRAACHMLLDVFYVRCSRCSALRGRRPAGAEW